MQFETKILLIRFLFSEMYEGDIESRLINCMSSILENLLSGRECAILFSGGLDSSVIAALAAKCSNPILYTVGLHESHDILAARKSSVFLNIPLREIIVTEDEIVDAIPVLADLISSRDPVVISYELPLYFVASNARESLLVSGQGADELFAGYKRYESLSGQMLLQRMQEDLSRLLSEGVETERKIARLFHKEIVHPYLDEKFLDFVLQIPIDERMRNGVRKGLLREVARRLGLGEISSLDKKAAQYGSGIMKTMKKAARKRKIHLKELVEQNSDSRK